MAERKRLRVSQQKYIDVAVGDRFEEKGWSHSAGAHRTIEITEVGDDPIPDTRFNHQMGNTRIEFKDETAPNIQTRGVNAYTLYHRWRRIF